MNLSGNVIFIPGATSGIGLALALRLKDAGNTVIIGGQRAELLAHLGSEHGFDTMAIDTADATSVLAVRDSVLGAHPDLNVVITMAGIIVAEDVRQADFLEAANSIVETNVLGPLRLVSAFTEHLQARTDATIMTVSSGLAHVPLAITPTYNGTKAFVHRFSETIRLQLADTSVRVLELAPPGVRTELMPGQSDVDTFVPLDAFADQVMSLITAEPDAHEILVDAVKPLRYAEHDDNYDQVVKALNAS